MAHPSSSLPSGAYDERYVQAEDRAQASHSAEQMQGRRLWCLHRGFKQGVSGDEPPVRSKSMCSSMSRQGALCVACTSFGCEIVRVLTPAPHSRRRHALVHGATSTSPPSRPAASWTSCRARHPAYPARRTSPVHCPCTKSRVHKQGRAPPRILKTKAY